MRVFHSLDQLPIFHNAVVTIGSFDGVHHGHQQILEVVRQLAASQSGESIVITFHPHPRQVVFPDDDSLQLLTSTPEKVAMLDRYGIDNVVVVPFTVGFSQQSADEYIEKFLVEKFQPHTIVIGYDHRFGSNRSGDIHYLQNHAKKYGYEVVEIPKQQIDEITVSSTKIRKAIENKQIESANQMLGHPTVLSGVVVKGQQIGRSIGFPTANLQVDERAKLIPPNGIYAVTAQVSGQEKRYKGMLYIGNRPTLQEGMQRSIEVNIFDFFEDIYGEVLFLELYAFLREDATFTGLEALKAQLAKDKLATHTYFLNVPTKNTSYKTAVAILNFNTAHQLLEFGPQLLLHTQHQAHIVVADNGSSDDSLAVARKWERTQVIDLVKNYGFAEGYNKTIAQLDAEYVVLLNSDIEVTENWLTPMIQYLDANPKVAAVQPKILSYHEKSSFEFAGASGGWIDALGYPFARGRVMGTLEKDTLQYEDVQEIAWASGAAMVVRKSLYDRFGGLDGDFFAHQEEIDLCWRWRQAGYSIFVVPTSVVYHVGGGTLAYGSPKKTYLNFRNNLSMILKNAETSTLAWLLPTRLVMDGLAGLQFLAKGQFSHILAILKAHFHFYARIPSILRKRQAAWEQIQQHTIGPDRSKERGFFKGSIVWQYFVRGKKRFQDIVE